MKVTRFVCDECKAEIAPGDQAFCIWLQGDSLAIDPMSYGDVNDYAHCSNRDDAKHICGVSCATKVANAWLEKRMQRRNAAAA